VRRAFPRAIPANESTSNHLASVLRDSEDSLSVLDLPEYPSKLMEEVEVAWGCGTCWFTNFELEVGLADCQDKAFVNSFVMVDPINSISHLNRIKGSLSLR
jgi:hypothetical protein